MGRAIVARTQESLPSVPYAGGVRVREPVARPLDVVAVELLLTASQAFLVGVLLYLAVGFWEDRGVGLGSAAAVLVLMAFALGGAWLYWLLGGVGWPLAAAATAAGLFLAAILLLTWFGEAFRVSGAPLLLAVGAAIYGVAAGVFLDSPRRWRWDQRERPRPGTRVPRLSDTTRALVAQVPRSIPRRAPRAEPESELAARIGASAPIAGTPDSQATKPRGSTAESPLADPAEPAESEASVELTDAPDVAGTPLEVPEAPEPVLPAARLDRAAASSGKGETDRADDAIELPTMVEPRAQRSPWSWAAPPAWNRDEDDERPTGSSSSRS
jgi:hypothetical protein